LANSNDLASASRVILLEIKSSTANSVPFSVKLGEGYNGGFQLDTRWLDGVISKMQNDAEKSIYQAGQALRSVFQEKANLIEKYVVEVDINASARIIRIE
jgi:hypothetical protein